MVAGIITAVCGGIVGIGGFIFGIIKWKAEQRAKAEAAAQTEEAEQKRLEEQTILKGVTEMIAPILEQNEEQSAAIDELRELHQDEMQNLKNLIDSNEKDRLRAEIMIFVNKLKNNQVMDSADFAHIHAVYTKYHNMGGNGYAEAEMHYIERKEREMLYSNE